MEKKGGVIKCVVYFKDMLSRATNQNFTFQKSSSKITGKVWLVIMSAIYISWKANSCQCKTYETFFSLAPPYTTWLPFHQTL